MFEVGDEMHQVSIVSNDLPQTPIIKIMVSKKCFLFCGLLKQENKDNYFEELIDVYVLSQVVRRDMRECCLRMNEAVYLSSHGFMIGACFRIKKEALRALEYAIVHYHYSYLTHYNP